MSKLKKMKIVTISAISLLLFFFSISHAEWWKDKETQTKLSLTQKQIEQADKIFSDYQKSVTGLNTKIKDMIKELNDMFSREKPDDKKFQETLDEVIKLRAEGFRRMVEMKLKIKSSLTEDQIKKLNSEKPGILTLRSIWGKKEKPLNPNLKEKPPVSRR
jgi:Spy/CpxP family protein refolding chaperone